MWPKLNTMKHFVTLAALLTSLSAFAQLPYNPDANNDGHIGAFDLTSLLSVYSGNFSNGVLSEGTSVLQPEILHFPEVNITDAFYNYDGSNSVVLDLSLLANNDEGHVWSIWVNTDGEELLNGTTVTLICPSGFDFGGIGFGDYFLSNAYSSSFANRFHKWVFWNGNWYKND